MVAYSFKARFAQPILDGVKCQTIRGPRRRHARPGEKVQLYTGMRTKHCRMIGQRACVGVGWIKIDFKHDAVLIDCALQPLIESEIARRIARSAAPASHTAHLDAFAAMDGFAHWPELRAFWKAEHGDLEWFDGVLIRWAAP